MQDIISYTVGSFFLTRRGEQEYSVDQYIGSVCVIWHRITQGFDGTMKNGKLAACPPMCLIIILTYYMILTLP